MKVRAVAFLVLPLVSGKDTGNTRKALGFQMIKDLFRSVDQKKEQEEGKTNARDLASGLHQVPTSRKLPPSQPPDPPDPELGDLVRLLRDPATGAPIPTAAELKPGVEEPADPICERLPEYEEDNSIDVKDVWGCCLQPLADVSSEDCPQDEDCIATADNGAIVVAVDPETCAAAEVCAPCIMETEFGRTSVVRTVEAVFDDQLREALLALRLSVCDLYADASGRLGYFVGDSSDESDPHTVDSPLQNIAMYREIMTNGLVNLTGLPGSPTPTPLQQAARFFGAAFGKTTPISLDAIEYNNAIMGLNEDGASSLLPERICVWFRREDVGEMVPVEQCFLDLSGFTYDRTANFGSLPSPAYLGSGVFEILAPIENDPPCDGYVISHANILDEVEFDTPEADPQDTALLFAQAADDARAVINHTHSWPVPAIDATSPPCIGYEAPGYNVYIESLQVPKNMRVGQEDREFMVKVGVNDGPTNAEFTLAVHATNDEGAEMVAGIHPKEWCDEEGLPHPCLGQGGSETFDLNAGMSKTFAGFVPADLTYGGASTITWTAEVFAEEDELSGDNVPDPQFQVTSIKAGGGGGGHMLRGL